MIKMSLKQRQEFSYFLSEELINHIPDGSSLDMAKFANETADFIEQSTKTFSDGIKQNPEEETLDQPHFCGVEDIDQKPLGESAFKVFKFLAARAGRYFTIFEIVEATDVCEVTVTSRIRDFRSEKWGSHDTPKRRREGERTWEYTLLPNKDSLTWRQFKKECEKQYASVGN